MKQVKRNKAKTWRKTYAKPFLIRRALTMVRVAANFATTQAEINAVTFTPADVALKALAIANHIKQLSDITNDATSDFNKGFINRSQHNEH